MNILDVAFVEELVDACQYLWEAGWGEYHAGNISYLLSNGEFDQLEEYIQVSTSVDVAFDTTGLKGKALIITKSGTCFRIIKKEYERDLGIIRFREDGYDILRGLDQGGGGPTSELPAHVLCHRARLIDDANDKIVMHCHPTYLNAMTMIHELDEESFTQTLWEVNSEYALVFPEGLVVLLWVECGEGPIDPATTDKVKDKRVVVWPFRGIFSNGNSTSDTIGLIEAIGKNAHIYVLVKANMMYGVTNENVRKLEEHLGPNQFLQLLIMARKRRQQLLFLLSQRKHMSHQVMF